MKCKSCGKEFDEEVGFCYFCGEEVEGKHKKEIVKESVKIKETPKKEYKQNSDVLTSKVGEAIKLFAVVVLILSMVGSLIISKEMFEIGISCLLLSVLFSLLSYGIGEIVCLLTAINDKMSN